MTSIDARRSSRRLTPGAMTTLTSRASATTVALIAGYSSYVHIAHVALDHGERPEVAYALPFAIDGLLLVATTAMLDDKRHHRRIRWSARGAFAFGVTASLAANVASAQPTTAARIVAAVPAIALLLAVEVISRTGRANPLPATAPANGHRTQSTGRHATRPTGTDTTETRPVATGPRPPRRMTATNRTAARVADLVAAVPDIDTAVVAKRLGVSTRTARRHLAAHRTSPTTTTSDAAPSSDGPDIR